LRRLRWDQPAASMWVVAGDAFQDPLRCLDLGLGVWRIASLKGSVQAGNAGPSDS